MSDPSAFLRQKRWISPELNGKKAPFWPLFGDFWPKYIRGFGPNLADKIGAHPTVRCPPTKKTQCLCPFVPKHPIWPKLDHFRTFPDATKKSFFSLFTTLVPAGGAQGPTPQVITEDKPARTDPPSHAGKS